MLGTGVIYSATATYAYIVTNNHVIERDDGTASKRIRGHSALRVNGDGHADRPRRHGPISPFCG